MKALVLLVTASALLLSLTTHSHGRSAILNIVHETYSKFIGHTALALGSKERNCLDNVRVTYHLLGANYSQVEYPASECRINMSLKFRAVVLPAFNIHSIIHRHQDPIDVQLSTIILKLSAANGIPHKPLFDSLDLGHECVIEYQDLGQVMLVETVIQATLETSVTIPPQCMFGNPENQVFLDTKVLNVPLNGTFTCKNGRSPTCNRIVADSSSPRYRIMGE